MATVGRKKQIDVFQASLLNIVAEASDIGINNFFENKKNELQRFIISQYIESLHATNPLRSKIQQHNLSHNQNLRYYENDHMKESKLKNEWILLLNPSKQKVNDLNPCIQQKRDDDINNDEQEMEIISYKSIGKSCWIYIVQNYLTQNDKIKIMPHLNHFFNDLVSDNLCWKDLSLTSVEINTNIPYYYNQFELFLSECSPKGANPMLYKEIAFISECETKPWMICDNTSENTKGFRYPSFYVLQQAIRVFRRLYR